MRLADGMVGFVLAGTVASGALVGCGDSVSNPDAGLGTNGNGGGNTAGTSGTSGNGLPGVMNNGSGVNGGSGDVNADGGLSGDSGGNSGGNGNLSADLPSGEAYGDWTYVEVDGALCRDGSPAGYYYREGSSPNLNIFLNGGGACADSFFCALNPSNVNEDLPHERLINATGNLLFLSPDPFRQVPPPTGIFKQDPANPVADWSAIFIPYCTGDVHAGTRRDVVVPGAESEGMNQFVGYDNIGLFLNSFGGHFSNAEKVILSGSSAGAFGTLLNFDRVQTFFDQWGSKVFALVDSGIPMRDSVGPDSIDYMAPCLQKLWRDLWGFDWLPQECTDCFRADGGGLVEGYGNYIFKEKYADRMLGGLISSVEDNVMRGFFGAGGNPKDPASNCSNTNIIGNVVSEAVITGNYPPETYHEGIIDAIDNVPGRDNVGYFLIPGDKHMHLWRDRFYTNETPLEMTLAQWVGEILQEKPAHVGQLDK